MAKKHNFAPDAMEFVAPTRGASIILMIGGSRRVQPPLPNFSGATPQLSCKIGSTATLGCVGFVLVTQSVEAEAYKTAQPRVAVLLDELPDSVLPGGGHHGDCRLKSPHQR